jgi:leader peptidase (prepilin peptidase)/N-methyltransferase
MVKQIMSFYINNPYLFYLFLIILGLCIGSFLNVVISRLPKALENSWKQQCQELLNYQPSANTADTTFSLLVPRSFCPKCNQNLRWWHNIPLISYLLLKGKCAFCQAHISNRYPLVELMTALFSLATVIILGPTAQGFFALLFIWFLITLAFIDIDTQLLPDNLTIPLLWLGLLINSFHVYISLYQAVWAAASGYLFLWVILKIFYLITQKEGMGEGDFKLFAAMGAWLGIIQLPLILFLASIMGSIGGLLQIYLYKQNKNIPFAFGPYLCISGIICLFWGQNIIDWYLNYILL